MFFAAKEAVERRAFQRGQRAGIDLGIDQGISRGRRQERARIAKLLAEHGVTLPPELARYLAGGCCDCPSGGNRAGGG